MAANGRHGTQTYNHVIETWTYADAATRAAATGFLSIDVGKVAYQTDTGSYWRLTATSPTWAPLGNTPGPRVTSITSSATPTPNADTTDLYLVTALAVGATFGAPTGTPVQGQKLTIRVKDNGSSQTLAYNGVYRSGTTVTLPTATTISKTLYCGFVYNSTDSKWDAVAFANGF